MHPNMKSLSCFRSIAPNQLCAFTIILTKLQKPFTMKQVIVIPSSQVKTRLTSAPIPEPSSKQVLIKVIVSGANPKDWKVPELAATHNGLENTSSLLRPKSGVNEGDDIAGIVEKVGKDVIEFRVRGLQRWGETKGVVM